MSEHIKKGKTIFGEIYLNPQSITSEKMGEEEWISSSWLKEQVIIEMEKHSKHDVFKCDALVFHKWFLSLLEEK